MNECKYCGCETIFYPLCCICDMGDEVTAVSSVRQLLNAVFTVCGRPDAAALMPAQCEYIDRPVTRSPAAFDGIVRHAVNWPGGVDFWAQAFADTLDTTPMQDLDIWWRVYVSRSSEIIINQ